MYLHELAEREPQTKPMNSVWPEMSTAGRDVDAMRKYLEGRMLSFQLAEENGWYVSRDANDDWLRVVIPALCREANHAYWQARAINPEARIRYQSPSGPRLDAIIRVNPFSAMDNAVDESENNGPDTQPISVICEGPMDALAAAELGYISYALMGITPPGSTLDFLANKLQRRPALVIFDNEAYAKTQGILTCVALASRGIRSRPCSVDGSKDLASMWKVDRKAFLAAQSTSLRGKQK